MCERCGSSFARRSAVAAAAAAAAQWCSGGGDSPQLHILCCNAGVLLNEKTLTSEGVEVTFACHLLFGTFLLSTLAMEALEQTEGSRVVVVSSGGMYNGKFPSWDVATSRDNDVTYDGNMAYVYCKRGQVLLCERWAKAHPTVKFVTCHPGWTNTPAVDAAYGENKKYLEPMRTPGRVPTESSGCASSRRTNSNGAFYLDRSPCVKHMAGPFSPRGASRRTLRPRSTS